MADDRKSDEELDAETRRGLRILADSTKAKGSEGAARRLYKAADTGSAADYEQAEALFDSLPPEKRSSIQSTAETTATTVRQTEVRRKKAQKKPAAAPAEFMTWELPDPQGTDGIFQAKPPEPERRPAAAPPREAPPQARARPQQPAQPAPRGDSSQAWELGRIPGNPKPARTRRDVDPDDDGQNWDWQKLPEDSVSRSRQKGKAAPKNELDALREEMLRTLKD
jgi:hypothetical protein